MVFFYLLFHLIGEDDFMEMRKSFYEKFGRRGATTADFISHLRAAAAKDLTRIIQEWVYGAESSRLIMEEVSLAGMIQRYSDR
jgi:hypothetical protein